jgi:N-acetylglutamate synthase-like GNAT family acetyltransferase
MKINYKINTIPKTIMIIDLYKSSGINRPVDDHLRISKMYANSNLVVTAWHEEELVGISRSLTDTCYSCYLSDLAVREGYKHTGIGKKMVQITRDLIGEQTMLLLLSAPSATEYYPKLGFQKADNGFIIKRKI